MQITSFPYTSQLDLTTLNFEDHINSSLTKLNDLNTYLNVETSEEGLKSIVVSIGDTFGQLLNTFKTNIFKFHRSLKRSELKAYVESNMLQLKIISKANYSDVKDIMVVAPNGLLSTYFQVTEDLNLAYNLSDILGIANLINSVVKDVLTTLQSNKNYPLKPTVDMILKRGSKIKVSFDKLNSNFSDKHTQEFKFSEKFLSIQELTDTKDLLLDMESRLFDVDKLNSILESIDGTLTAIIDILKDDTSNEHSKEFINDLSTIVRSMATIMEGYASYVEIHMSLEHNLTYVFKAVYKKLS